MQKRHARVHLMYAFVSACPYLFVATHLYSPESSGYTGEMSIVTNPKSNTVLNLLPVK